MQALPRSYCSGTSLPPWTGFYALPQRSPERERLPRMKARLAFIHSLPDFFRPMASGAARPLAFAWAFSMSRQRATSGTRSLIFWKALHEPTALVEAARSGLAPVDSPGGRRAWHLRGGSTAHAGRWLSSVHRSWRKPHAHGLRPLALSLRGGVFSLVLQGRSEIRHRVHDRALHHADLRHVFQDHLELLPDRRHHRAERDVQGVRQQRRVPEAL